MGAIVSSRFDYIENNPKAQLSYAEVDHELNHLKKREHVSSLAALGALVLGLLTVTGVLGGGAFLLGALFAIAGVAAAYAYCCRMAESGLRDRQMIWFVGANPSKVELLPPKPEDASSK